MQKLFQLIRIVPNEDLLPFETLAVDALQVDPDDVPYLACALAVDADAIWSHDPHFDAQDLVPRVTNADLMSLL